MNRLKKLVQDFWARLQKGARQIWIDISKWQGDINDAKLKAKVKAGELMGMIVRASVGLLDDIEFERNYKFMEDNPEIWRGAYHYLTSSSPWRAQLQKFLKRLEGKEIDIVVVDAEAKNNKLDYNYARAVVSFYLELKKLGYFVILYTGKYDYQTLRQHAPEIDDFYLWLAQYPYSVFSQWLLGWVRRVTTWPSLPKTAKRALLVIWQFTDRGLGKLWGMLSYGLDMNVVVKDQEWLLENVGIPNRWLADPVPIEQPPTAGLPSTQEQLEAMLAMSYKEGFDAGQQKMLDLVKKKVGTTLDSIEV